MQPNIQLSLLGLEGALSSLSRLLARECVCVYVCQFVTEWIEILISSFWITVMVELRRITGCTSLAAVSAIRFNAKKLLIFPTKHIYVFNS